VVLADPVYTRPREEPALPIASIVVNQVGYLPLRAKVATLMNPSTEPLAWTLRSGQGEEVASGRTQLVGADEASGKHVHLVDFSSFQQPGDGYALAVGEHVSQPQAQVRRAGLLLPQPQRRRHRHALRGRRAVDASCRTRGRP
jgi:endoglucanase